MFLAAQTGAQEGRQGEWGGRERRREATSISATTPIESRGHYFHGCPLWALRPAYCDRMTLTAVSAQSSLSPSFVLIFFICSLGALEEKRHKYTKNKLNSVSSKCYTAIDGAQMHPLWFDSGIIMTNLF